MTDLPPFVEIEVEGETVWGPVRISHVPRIGETLECLKSDRRWRVHAVDHGIALGDNDRATEHYVTIKATVVREAA